MEILGTAFGIIIGVASLVFAIYTERKRRREKLHRQQRFEWNHVGQGIRQLCKTIIQRDGFNPDFFLAVPGAGVALTELALIEIGREYIPIYIIQQKRANSKESFGSNDGYEFKTSKWRYWIPDDVLNRNDCKVLIFDDYVLSGDTLYELKASLVKNGFDENKVKTVALISTISVRRVEKEPDYSWFWVDSADVHMPWGHADKSIRMGEVDTT